MVLQLRTSIVDTISDFLHDALFDVALVRHDDQRQLVTIPFTFPQTHARRREDGILSAELEIGRVVSWAVNDRARVEVYEFNALRISSRADEVTIVAGLPLKAVATVDSLNVILRFRAGGEPLPVETLHIQHFVE